jgi:cephalosporin-C deacetylase
MDTHALEKFWADTLERTRREPLDAEVRHEQEPVPYFTYRVSYRSLGGVRITARLAKPVTDGIARLPVIVTAPGYGGWEHGIVQSECQRGYIVLQVYPRHQGESSDLPRGEKIKGPGYLLWGIERPEGYFYQGAFMDVVRGIDYLVSCPDVDASKIGFMGTSQGGGIVLSVAGIDARVKAVVAHVPFFCDMRRNPAFRETELARPEALATFDYFDPVSLAPRVKVPVLLSSGGKDATCPPPTIAAVFDRLVGIRTLMHYPDLTHTSCPDFYGFSWQWMARYLA